MHLNLELTEEDNKLESRVTGGLLDLPLTPSESLNLSENILKYIKNYNHPHL